MSTTFSVAKTQLQNYFNEHESHKSHECNKALSLRIHEIREIRGRKK